MWPNTQGGQGLSKKITCTKDLTRFFNSKTHRIRAKNALDAPIFAIFEVNSIRALTLVVGPETAQLALVLGLVCAWE